MRNIEHLDLPDVAESFLSDLAFALRGAEERDDVLYEVRDHLMEVMRYAPRGQQYSAVRAAIEQLGTVAQIASTSTRRASPPQDSNPEPVRHHGARFSTMLKLVAAIASIPAAFALPLYGGVFALFVFIWCIVDRPWSDERSRASIVFAGLGLVLAVIMFTLQLPFSPGPISVDLPVHSDLS